MKRALVLCSLFVLAACKTTPSREDGAGGSGDEITISADDLEPLQSFVLETRRILVGEFVRVEASSQFFESKMGFTRDFRYVERTNKVLPDGTEVIILRNKNRQQTNIDPDLLPRVYFGEGLEARAYNELRIYLRRARSKERPLFLDIIAKGGAKLWVNGRLVHEEPSIRIQSALLWSEDRERYLHHASIG